MAYQYDQDGGLQPEQPRPPKKNSENNDLGSWIIIGAMFLFGLWPVGLILLVSKPRTPGPAPLRAARPRDAPPGRRPARRPRAARRPKTWCGR